MKGLLLASVVVLLHACREPAPPTEAPAPDPAPAASMDECTGRRPCPAGCYKGPSYCSGGACSRDISCRPAGYDPRSSDRERPQSSLNLVKFPHE